LAGFPLSHLKMVERLRSFLSRRLAVGTGAISP
jgi:hypothetical protein